MDIDADKLTPAQLDKIAEHLIEKALGDNPRAIAEVDRRLAAGLPVTIEDCMQAGGQEPVELRRHHPG